MGRGSTSATAAAVAILPTFAPMIAPVQADIETSFVLFAQPQAAWDDAWNTIVRLLRSGAIKPMVAKTFPLNDAAAALHYLIDDRPFGRVVLTI
jgi:NADPH:quinone reductase-like Zn-dependent oxidoreductase